MRTSTCTKGLAVLAALVIVFGVSSNFAAAQFYPDGATIIYPGRMNPLANIPYPGSTGSVNQYVPGVGWVSGNTWIGLDGRPHGDINIVDPYGNSSTHHYFAPNRGSWGNNQFRTSMPTRTMNYRQR